MDGTGDGGFWIPTSSSARCGVGLGELALPGAAARGSPRRALMQIPKTLTGSQRAEGMLSADQISTFNRSVNIKQRLGSVFLL